VRRMSDEATLPRLLRRNAEEMASRPAIREKRRGIWQSFTWARYWQEVRELALGLSTSGFNRGDKLAVIGDNRPRLYWAQLAAQCLGGTAVPVYQDSIAAELAYVLGHADVSVIVAENQEQVDKILSLKDRLPRLRLLLYDDPLGMAQYDEALLTSFEQMQAAGRTLGAGHPGHVEEEIDAGSPDDLALLVYTSGTTGNPKGVMLSHRNLIAAARAFTAAEKLRPDDEILCYLPMAWVGDAFYSTAMSLFLGFTCNCPESPETVQRDLRELGPTALLAPPRIWENLLTSVQVRAADATPVKRRLFETFRALADRAELMKSEGREPPAALRLALMVGEFLIFGPVRDRLGLRRVRLALTGGAPLGPDAFRFFRSFGVNLKQIYGATELCGLVALQPDGEADPNTVGRVCPGTEVRLDRGGEVLVHSAAMFEGYYKQPDASASAITADGWLRTGDAGFLDPRGHLVIIDRIKDVGKLADGSPFAPQFLENKLKFSPYISEAVAFGDERPFVATMIVINAETVGHWAERRSISYTSFQDLSANPNVRELVRDEIRKCNAGLPPAARVRRFLLLNKQLDADDNEITRTRKIRRRFIAEKYGRVVEALYAGRSDVELVTDITFEDGRKSTIRSNVAIDEAEAVPQAMMEPAHA
jgi:long-chain acyl-CoA synthetase